MRKHYTESEIKKILSRMTIIIDTREQENKHLTNYFDDKKIPYVTRKLSSGDYSVQFTLDETQTAPQTFSLEDDIVIEKKNSLDEIAGNFTIARERFEREFLRAKATGTKVYLLVENASYEAIEAHAYRSKFAPKAFLASLLSWQARFGITVVFCKREESPKIIHGILYYALKEKLEGGKI